ncbi:MAG: ribonuclease J [Alphaproteobacteria bacterium]
MAAASDKNEFVFLPLGGCGEVGMNLNLFGYGPPGDHEWMMADLGVTFADLTAPGIDLILPDPAFITERRKKLKGIVFTHAHEDHIGAAAALWPWLQCPMYATPFTAELLRAKFVEAGIADEAPLHVLPVGGRFSLGPFDLELIRVAHSIPEAHALAIRTPAGIHLHTGDWKLDPDPVVGEVADEARLRALGEEGVMSMTCDSTNVFVPGTAGSEAAVGDSLTELFGELEGRIAVTAFASNVARVNSVARAAAAHKRHLVLVGRAMHRIVSAAKACGMLQDMPAIVPEEDAGYLPPDSVVYLCTGSQGEPRAALARIADGGHPHVSLEDGDTVVFSSRVIPGNEVAIFDIQNRLAERGIRVISEEDHFVHVSGHPCRDELKQLYGWVRPETAVPIHGELRHLLEHRLYARELGADHAIIARNGAMLRLAPGPAEIINHVENGRLYLDGEALTSSDNEALRLRRRLSFSGAIVVTLAVGRRLDLLCHPRVLALGVPEEDEEEEGSGPRNRATEDRLAAVLADDVDGAFEGLSKRQRADDVAVEEAVRRAVRAVVRPAWGKRPLIRVEILRIDA